MTGYNYSTFVTAIATQTGYDPTNVDFLNNLPRMIEQAEGRCYRDVDLLGVYVTDATTSLAAGARDVSIPTANAAGRFRSLSRVNLLISGVRTPLVNVSLDALDVLWPSSIAPSTASLPSYFANRSDTQISVGPTLGSAAGSATIEFVGPVMPPILSSGNATTYLSTYLPDLFFTAVMIYMSGYMKNYGNASDDPQQGMTWEMQYQKLLAGVSMQEARRRFASASWTSAPAEPAASAQRG